MKEEEKCEELPLKGTSKGKKEPTGESCQVVLASDKSATEKPKKEKLIPDELKEPNPNEKVPSDEREFLLPNSIEIYNHRVEAKCETEGTEGEVKVVEEKTFSSVLYFSLILSLTEEVLDYIARAELEETIEEKIHEGSLTPHELRRLTGMTLKQGQEFLNAAYALQEQQDAYAKGYAQVQLVCRYWNSSQTETCQDQEMAHPGDAPGAIFSVTVEAHQYSSTVSQEDADRKAQESATAQLQCFYLNDEIDVDCLTWPGRPVDYSEEVPNDEEEIYPGRGLRVGHVHLAAGLYSSPESKEVVNQFALQEAYSRLRCWFPNDPVEVECEDPIARNLGVLSSTPPKEADPKTWEKGQHVYLPPGFTVSDVSREEATKEAQLLADSLLECCYVNDAITVRCEAQTIKLDDGRDKTVYPDPDSSILEFTIPEGTYSSCYSKEDANELARQATEGMLDCRYCNGMVLPTCVPDWVLAGVQLPAGHPNHIDLPLQSIITDGEHTLNALDLPPEATIGVPERAYCINDAQLAQDIADAAARVPAAGTEGGCIYPSDAVYMTCAGVDPRTGETRTHGVIHHLIDPDDGTAYYFYTMYPPSSCLAEGITRPPHGEYIYNPAGLFTSVGSDEEANEKSIQLAKAQLFCVWENPLTKGICGGTESGTSLCDDLWITHKATAGAGNSSSRLAPWSNSSSNPIIFPRGYVRYVGSGNDMETARSYIYTAVKRMVNSMIICIYGNQEAQAQCQGVGTERLDDCGSVKLINNGTSGIIQSNVIFSDSPTEANAIAQELADGIAACDEDTIMTFGFDWPDYPPPPPINPGGGGNTPNSSSKPDIDPGGGGGGLIGPGPGNCYYDCPFYRRGYVSVSGASGASIANKKLDQTTSEAAQNLISLRIKVRKMELKLKRMLEDG